MLNLRKFMDKINTGEKHSPQLRYDEPMSKHTSFKVGGKADVWVKPLKSVFPAYAEKLLKAAKEEGIPVFILGGGANIVVSDRGIRGIVLDTGAFRGIGKKEARKISEEETPGEIEADRTQRDKSLFSVLVNSGTSMDELGSRLADRSLSGLEFLAGMPGSIGGAVWMNARCYEKSVSDVLLETEILDENFTRQMIPFRPEDFSYKKSPFQSRDVLILKARFAVEIRESQDIQKDIISYRQDRDNKGHYRFPSAGSAFKNNQAFGDPTGKIIDRLGLRGFSVGGAQVAPWHGNIIINTGNATASDIRVLVDEIVRQVKKEHGFELENEILFVGDWEEYIPILPWQ